MASKIYAISFSGGKDSTAALLWMLENYSHKGDINVYFSDTGWEHPLTYEYINYIEKELGIVVNRIKSKKYPGGFKQMVVERGVFPSRIMRFCTQELKLYPAMDYLAELQKTFSVVNVTGVRADESRARSGEGIWKTTFFTRSKSKKIFKTAQRVTVFQPIVYWSEDDVYDYIKKSKIKINPLYMMGHRRVGCYPCIMSSIIDMRMVDDNRIKEIRELEDEVRRRGNKEAVFWYRGPGEMKTIDERIREIGKYNPLGLDLGCINHLGKCE
jgi:3'-phosphoadenosine 5'-phosphosulfate sulfotransferase (PAPS reductase)/FAD synthetase